MPLEGAASITFVRSLLAHAGIEGIDASAAEALPNVQVFTAADLDLGSWDPPPLPGMNTALGRPLIARDRVRFVGDIVAVVVSDDRATGVDAAELVFVDYDQLPVVVDPEEAVKDEVLLFPEAGTNVAARSGSAEHDEQLFAECDVVVTGRLNSQRMAPCPLEPRSDHALALDADATPGPLCARRDARARARPDPRRRP
jgi:aerobic carbon-monoxide dehydrogenase large subunit